MKIKTLTKKKNLVANSNAKPWLENLIKTFVFLRQVELRILVFILKNAKC